MVMRCSGREFLITDTEGLKVKRSVKRKKATENESAQENDSDINTPMEDLYFLDPTRL
jgi:hypothetical protein